MKNAQDTSQLPRMGVQRLDKCSISTIQISDRETLLCPTEGWQVFDDFEWRKRLVKNLKHGDIRRLLSGI